MLKLEDLALNGLKIYQDDSLYRFTSDSVILSRFAKVKKGDIVADFCSGSGIVGLHLYGLNPVIKSVTLFEMQPQLYKMSKKTIDYNNLSEVFNAVNCKVQDIDKSYNEKFSLIVCNPPYRQQSAGEENQKENISCCRFEKTLTIKELCLAFNKALKFGGRVNMICRADRLVEVIYELKANNLEPKRLQFVSGKDKEPYAFLIEGVKGGKPSLKVLNTLIN